MVKRLLFSCKKTVITCYSIAFSRLHQESCAICTTKEKKVKK
jgi:hypothetical protein